jgi:hypothetical protein
MIRRRSRTTKTSPDWPIRLVTTSRLLRLLPTLGTRTAVVTASGDSCVEAIEGFVIERVASVGGDDFVPPQPTSTRLIKIGRPNTQRAAVFDAGPTRSPDR